MQKLFSGLSDSFAGFDSFGANFRKGLPQNRQKGLGNPDSWNHNWSTSTASAIPHIPWRWRTKIKILLSSLSLELPCRPPSSGWQFNWNNLPKILPNLWSKQANLVKAALNNSLYWGKFLSKKICHFEKLCHLIKNSLLFVPFVKIGPIGRPRLVGRNGQQNWAAELEGCRFQKSLPFQ